METGRAWLVLTLGDEREYAGNDGYADELESVYRYDSFVPNHTKIAVGDLFVLRNKTKILGTARVSRLLSKKGRKKFKRCPQCGVANIKEREHKRPKFKCRKNHVFPEFVSDSRECVHFAAYFDGSFQSLDDDISVNQARAACPRYNGQLAMQEVDIGQLKVRKSVLVRGQTEKYVAKGHSELSAADAADESYAPDGVDDRQVVEKQIKERRGQKRFRNALRKRFVDTCIVTNCRVVDLLEAAHINPHRGVKDNHQDNGMLLRTDIHTLFDLNLLGVEPQSLRIRLHPKLKGSDYEQFEGVRLSCDAKLLSKSALESRWNAFQARLKLVSVVKRSEEERG